MSQAANTGSTLTFPGGANKTSTAISTNIIITVRTPNGNIPVGAIQKLDVKEQREVKMIDEVGTDGHIDSVPTRSTDISGSCERVRFDRLRITEAFSRGFLHVASQAYPFDIIIMDKQKTDSANQITTVIKNVWITDISYGYNAGDWIISDNMSWKAERIFSILNNGGATPAAQGGEIGIKFSNIGVEREADTGANGRGGALDASGLIDLGSDGTLF